MDDVGVAPFQEPTTSSSVFRMWEPPTWWGAFQGPKTHLQVGWTANKKELLSSLGQAMPWIWDCKLLTSHCWVSFSLAGLLVGGIYNIIYIYRQIWVFLTGFPIHPSASADWRFFRQPDSNMTTYCNSQLFGPVNPTARTHDVVLCMYTCTYIYIYTIYNVHAVTSRWEIVVNYRKK